MSAYCSRAEAVAAGADDSDLVALDAAIVAASARVDGYTGSFFDQRTLTVPLEVEDGGLAFLPAEGTVTAVRLLRPGQPAQALDAAAFHVVGTRLYTPAATGDADILVAGAEPYRGGYARLLGPVPTRLEVDGVFGPASTPEPVSAATALVTALLRPRSYTPTADAEGVPQGVEGGAGMETAPEVVRPVAGRLEATTGVAEADRLLQPYRVRGGFRFG